MTQTITGLFNTHAEAMAAVEDLHGAGILEKDISIVANNGDGGYSDDADDGDIWTLKPRMTLEKGLALALWSVAPAASLLA